MFDCQLSWEPSTKFSTTGHVVAAGNPKGRGSSYFSTPLLFAVGQSKLPPLCLLAKWFLFLGATQCKSAAPVFVSGYHFISYTCSLSYISSSLAISHRAWLPGGLNIQIFFLWRNMSLLMFLEKMSPRNEHSSAVWSQHGRLQSTQL